MPPVFIPYEEINVTLNFTESRFPECDSYGTSGGPGFKTSVFEVDSGLATTTVEWDRMRARYDVTFENTPPADIVAIENFFYGMRGRAIGFRYKDFNDFQINNQLLLVGDGTTKDFQIVKQYSSGSETLDRIITKPVAGTLILLLDGVTQVITTDYTIDTTTGIITFDDLNVPASGALGVISYVEYDVPVRFDSDDLDISYDDFRQLNIGSVPLIEILL